MALPRRPARDRRTPRTVLITGASSGIGRATALELAGPAVSLALVSRSATPLAEVAAACERAGAVTTCVEADVSDAASVAAAFEQAERALGPIDGVVHAAAVLTLGRFESVPAADFDRVVAVNVIGTANVVRTATARFRDRDGGSLVVVGSLLGRIGSPYLSGYVASKWAVHGLVRTLQIEARRTPGVRIGLVTPGGVDTPIYDVAASYLGRKGRPPPPVDPPEKVARAVVASLARPRRNASVGLANGPTALAFRMAPGVHDRAIAAYMDLALRSRTPTTYSSGNLWHPLPELAAVRGRWGRHWLRGVGVGSAGALALATAEVARRTRGRRG